MQVGSRRLWLRPALTCVLAAAVMAYGARVLFVEVGWHVWWDGVLLSLALLLAAATLAVRAATAPRARRAWLVIAAGVSSYVAGFFYWLLAVRSSPVHPTPSLADALWLSLYPSLYVGLALLVRDAGFKHRASFWLDGLVAGSATAAVGAWFLVPAAGAAGAAGQTGVAINLAYAAGDLCLLLLTVSVIVAMRLRVPTSWWILAVGLLLLMAAEFAFFSSVTQDADWDPAGVSGLAYLLGLGAIALAAGRRDRVPAQEPGQGWPALLIPVMALAVATAMLVFTGRGRVNVVVDVLAAFTIMLTAVRLLLTFAEIRRLAASDALSITDDLTGLHNRRGFYRHATRHLMAGHECTLVLIDLNEFKEVNDTLGHVAGDRLLAAVAERLSGVARISDQARFQDVLGRLGGDEFAALMPATAASRGAEAARRLTSALRDPFTVEGVSLHVSASAGVVEAPGDGTTIDVLLRKADVAMYQAKHRGGGVERYRRETDTRTRTRLHLMEQVRSFLDGGLRVHFQPQICLRTGAVVAVEALARLEDHRSRLLVPAEFMPFVTDADLATQMTEQIVHMSLGQVALWKAQGHVVPVAINVRADAFHDELLPPLVDAALERHGLDGRYLIVEVTENFLMADRPTGRAAIERLRALGVSVSIDDFGTGYSSLAYLRDLPVDELKLDRSFVTGMSDDARARRIVQSTIELAHGLEMRLVAEGVETWEVVGLLQEQRCEAAQGFVFARPAPADDLAPLLHRGVSLPSRPLSDV